MQNLSSIEKTNRILDDVDETSKEGGLSTEEEISYYNSTSNSEFSTSDFGFANTLSRLG